MRISQENVHRRGTPCHQPSPSQGPQAIDRLNFPKFARLRTRRDFKLLKTERKRFIGRVLVIEYRTDYGEMARLGISAPRKIGHAPFRNRFKRLVREVFRLCHQNLPPILIHVLPKKGLQEISLDLIATDFKDFAHALSESSTTASR